MKRENAFVLVITVFAATLALLPGLPALAQHDHFRWQLLPPTWTNANDGAARGEYTIDEVKADALGGFVRLTAIGRESFTGKTQRFKFCWKFDRDITFVQGKHGDAVFSVSTWIEGDSNGFANPYWYVMQLGDLFSLNPPYDRYYFQPQPGEYRGPRTASLNHTGKDPAVWGLRFNIAHLLVGWTNGIDLRVDYLYQPVDGAAGPGGGGDKRARCDEYAKQAANQNQINQKRRCGFTGPRWQSDYNAHFNWCMGVDAAAADAEARARQEELKGCKGTWTGLGGGTVLGGLDLDAFCKSKGAAGVRLDGQDWKCVFPDGTEKVINLTNACRKQYGEPTAVAEQTRPGDPQSWTCVIAGK